jgi:uncharacterized membrane protein YobD (UPF0266 family)
MSDYYTIKPLVSNIFQLYAIKYYNGMLNDKIQVTFYLNFNLHVLKFYASHEKKKKIKLLFIYFYFYQILSTFNKFKIMSEVSHDNL